MIRDVIRSAMNLKRIRLLWIYVYLLKAVTAALFVLPLFIVTNAALAPSRFSHSLLKGWDLSVVIEFMSDRSETMVPVLVMFMAGILFFIGMMQFVNGGLYYLMVSGRFERPEWKMFFAECGVNFGIHVRISLLMLLVYAILLPGAFFLANLIGAIGGRATGSTAMIIMLIKIGIIFLVLLAASTFSDSARAASAANPGKRMKELLSTAADFFRPRMIRLVGLFLLTYIPFIIIWLVITILATRTITLFDGLLAIVLEFILLQIASMARSGQKLWYLINVGKTYRDYNPGRFLPTQAELPLE